jgi:hypothetical protein
MKQFKIIYYESKSSAFATTTEIDASEFFEAIIQWQKKETQGLLISITCLNPRKDRRT